MHANEEAVQALVQRIGLSGLFQGLQEHLGEYASILAETSDEDDEPDSKAEWLSTVRTLVSLATAYAFALEDGRYQSTEQSDSGATLSITVDTM